MSENTKRKLVPDFRIARLSILGLCGFILGCVFLFYPDLLSLTKQGSVFHEIIYVPKDVISQRIDSVIDSLNKVQIPRQARKTLITDSLKNLLKSEKDSGQKLALTKSNAENDQLIAIDDNNLKTLRSLQASYQFTSAHDTTSFQKLNKLIHFNIAPQDLKKWNDHLNEDSNYIFTATYSLKDPGLSFSIWGHTDLVSKAANSDIAFITKYPGAGIWILLLMIFCSFLLIAISTSIYLRSQTIELFKNCEITGPERSEYFIIVAVTFVCLFLIWGIGKISFNDEDVVRGIFFMLHLKTSMMLVQILGFVGGAFCLAGFIHTASMLAYFAKSVKRSRKSVKEKKALLEQKEIVVNPETNGETQAELDKAVDEEKQDREIYEKLKNYFTTYFIISAIILSLLVLCTGGLYEIINNLDFVRLLSDDWGYSPARSDFVYLYGGFYTVILLLVYIPAKMRFSEISFTTEESGATSGATPEQEGSEKWYSFLKEPFSQIKELLVAASPLLASLIQTLFQTLFG